MLPPKVRINTHRTTHSRHNRIVELRTSDLELLRILSTSVRVLSMNQVERTWFRSQASARRRLRQLVSEGVLREIEILARPELPLSMPVSTWAPGEPSPNFEAVAYQLQRRWVAPAEIQLAVIASRFGANFHGGSGDRVPRATEQTHDLHLATVFLHYRKNFPALITTWRSEDALRRLSLQVRGGKIPDAIIIENSSQKIIEFGGAYKAKKLADFHESCRKTETPYEIW